MPNVDPLALPNPLVREPGLNPDETQALIEIIRSCTGLPVDQPVTVPGDQLAALLRAYRVLSISFELQNSAQPDEEAPALEALTAALNTYVFCSECGCQVADCNGPFAPMVQTRLNTDGWALTQRQQGHHAEAQQALLTAAAGDAVFCDGCESRTATLSDEDAADALRHLKKANWALIKLPANSYTRR